ncbi:MAG: D-aminoacyl-tRNA deacylase [Xanthomonadales bacterium]|nr:D-aminoacyl-tRNA deacylase [Xanthomonadales bacterium]
MISLIQRVSQARVEVDATVVGAIGPGLLALVAVEPEDDDEVAGRMLERLLDYRVFADEQGRMNRSLREVEGGLLLVPQFTLAANTAKGLRPGFDGAAPPALARSRFQALVDLARSRWPGLESGRFGAHMQVHLVNDGPVTFWLQVG